jgi:hypothetical protein
MCVSRLPLSSIHFATRSVWSMVMGESTSTASAAPEIRVDEIGWNMRRSLFGALSVSLNGIGSEM